MLNHVTPSLMYSYIDSSDPSSSSSVISTQLDGNRTTVCTTDSLHHLVHIIAHYIYTYTSIHLLLYLYTSTTTPTIDASNINLVPMRNVKSLGCGAYHCLVVGLGDQVYACGLNNYGQLGLGPLFEAHHPQQNYLTLVPLLCNKGIVSLKGGVHHSLVSSSTGVLSILNYT